MKKFPQQPAPNALRKFRGGLKRKVFKKLSAAKRPKRPGKFFRGALGALWFFFRNHFHINYLRDKKTTLGALLGSNYFFHNY